MTHTSVMSVDTHTACRIFMSGSLRSEGEVQGIRREHSESRGTSAIELRRTDRITKSGDGPLVLLPFVRWPRAAGSFHGGVRNSDKRRRTFEFATVGRNRRKAVDL